MKQKLKDFLTYALYEFALILATATIAVYIQKTINYSLFGFLVAIIIILLVFIFRYFLKENNQRRVR